jgi:hypothetical protein
MSDTNIEPPPSNTQLDFIDRFRKGIFFRPKEFQIFKTNLNVYKETTSTDPDNPNRIQGWGYDNNRRSKISEIEKKIAKAIDSYLKSYNKDSPITFENDTTISGNDAPIEKALTKITITKPNNIVKEYTGDELQELKNRSHDISQSYRGDVDNGFTWSELTTSISNKDGGIAGSEKATLTFDLDMSKLLSTSSGGRRSFRKNYKKVKSSKRGRSMKRYVSKSRKSRSRK